MQLPTRALLGLLALPLPAQTFDLLGVTFTGQVLRIDSTTGATQLLASGAGGKNCLCFGPDDRLWTTVRTGTTGNFQYHLAVIDPFTGAETLPFGTLHVGDLRGMALSGDQLLAIRDQGTSDELIRIDPDTGAVAVIGPTGMTGLQGLDSTVRGMRGWDVNLGLVQIDPTTGVASDPFPGVSGPTGLQWLCSENSSGRLLVGRTTLQAVDLSTGTVGPAIAVAGAPDLRGVEFTTGRATRFGSGCAGVRMGARFLNQDQTLVTTSGTHTSGALGVQLIGFSATVHQGQPLPFALDPLLGTSGCQLWVSIDVTQIGVADASGRLAMTVNVPTGLSWFPLFVQHAAFDAVPGGTAWTDAARARTRR